MPESYSEADIAELTFQFPKAFTQAQVDWAKFKLGVKAGLFTPAQTSAVMAYYSDFGKLWEIVRPNWFITPQGNPTPEFAVRYAKIVDTWVATLGQERLSMGLGIAPLIIAGILIAGLFGIAGATWAVGYLKAQQNTSDIIAGVVDKTIPPSVLEKAIQAEQSASSFGGLVDLFKWGAIAVGLYLFLPVIKDVVTSKK